MAAYTVRSCWCCGCPCEWPANGIQGGRNPHDRNPRCDRCRAECFKPGAFVTEPPCKMAVAK